MKDKNYKECYHQIAIYFNRHDDNDMKRLKYLQAYDSMNQAIKKLIDWAVYFGVNLKEDIRHGKQEV